MLGVLPGLIGCIQATEAVKLILGRGEPLIGRLLLYDALQMSFREFKVRRNPKCPSAATTRPITKLIDYDQFCGIRGQEGPAMAEQTTGETTVEELKQRLDRGEKVFILDVRNPEEYQICRIPGSTLIPLPTLPQRFAELKPRSGNGRPLQERDAQPEGDPVSPAAGVHEADEPQGRHPGVGGSDRPDDAEVLRGANVFTATKEGAKDGGSDCITGTPTAKWVCDPALSWSSGSLRRRLFLSGRGL